MSKDKSALIRWYAYHHRWEAEAKANEINRYLSLDAKVVKQDNELLPWTVEVYAPMREV